MKKPLHLLSLFLLVAVSFVMSCSKDDPKPDACDGTLTVALDSKTNLTTCTANDGSITVSASGGNEPYQYSLNGGAKQTSATFSGLSAGAYSVTVFDSKNCEDTETGISITSPSNLGFASVTPTADTDCSGNNGSISAVGTGGTEPYEYALNDGDFQVDGTFSNRAPGTYSVKVRDNLDCIFTQSATITQSTSISYAGRIKPIIDANCATSSSCHGSGASRPVFTTHDVIEDNAAGIKSRTQNGSMPQGGWKNLSEQQIDQIKADIACWVDGGAPNN